MTKQLHILGYFPWKFLFLRSLENLQKFDYIITGIEWDSYILKNRIFFLVTILDLSARHQLCHFMPTVLETTDHAEPNVLVNDTSCSMRVGY